MKTTYNIELKYGRIYGVFQVIPGLQIGTWRYKKGFSIELCWLGFGVGIGFIKHFKITDIYDNKTIH